MKKFIFQFSLLVLGTYAAQAQQSLQVAYYQIDDKFILETFNAKPNALIDYYSTPEGGFWQASNKANEFGLATLETNLDHLPAFSLSDKYVKHLGEREFLLSDLKANREGNTLHLQWQGAASMPNAIDYVVLKSTDGKQFEPLETIPAWSAETQRYTFEDEYNAKASYRLAVRKNKNQERYLSKEIQIDTDTDPYTMYPTYTQGHVHIDFVNADFQGEYKVHTQTGQLLASGSLTSQFNILDISSYSKGIYMIEVLVKGGVSSTQKVTKQ